MLNILAGDHGAGGRRKNNMSILFYLAAKP